MPPNGIGFVIVALCLSVALAQDKPATPAEKYQALLKEQQNGPDELLKAATSEERKQIQARLGTLPMRFVELAEENPKDPVAVEALIKTVASANGTAFPEGGKDKPGQRALALLQRDHARSDRLGSTCQQVLFGFHRSRETFLRAVLEANPHRQVQALACLSLAQYLNDRLNRLNLLPDSPELIERYHRVFGKEYVEELQRQDQALVAKEAEALFTRAAAEYADVEIPVTYFGSGSKVGAKANQELFKIRNLAVGKVAPDIEGEDQDGKPFKLSDYRGKVVLLDIWHRL
jgi:hypothetical protein